MTRPRGVSVASEDSAAGATTHEQELGSMYDYLAKVILLGPSGTGKFVKNEWRVLSSQTIGVEFATKIIKIGTGPRRKRIKLQLWDTAGTERFRSVSRSYYRGAAGAVLVYDVASHASFRALQPFLNDARALASPNLSILLVGNKLDLASDQQPQPQPQQPQQQPQHRLVDTAIPPATPSSYVSASGSTATTSSARSEDGDGDDPLRNPWGGDALSSSISTTTTIRAGGGGGGGGGGALPARATNTTTTMIPEIGREVTPADASRWASTVGIPVVMETSALNGEGVDEVFGRLARIILTKIELGDINPDDPNSGIQYGDGYYYSGGGGAAWNASDGASIGSSVTNMTVDEGGGAGGSLRRRRRAAGALRVGGGGAGGGGGGGSGSGSASNRGSQNWGALREWEEVFALSSSARRRRRCC